jgi:hypothetical protein
LTSGTKAMGEQPGSWARQFRSLSMSMCMGRAQWAHSVLTVTDTCSFLRRPCTKGVANASAAQAAYSSSPVWNVMWCGVVSVVTG